MTCRTILSPQKRIEANADDHRFRGLEVAPKSKSTDVYLVMRVNAELALYIKALAFSFGSDISATTENFIRWAVHNEFCARNVPEWRREFVAKIMKMEGREAFVELLDPESAAPIDKEKN